MIYLEYFLYIRLALVWNNRTLPSYLGPSPFHLIFLFVFSVVNIVTLFALGVLLARNLWVLGSNTTTIEGWEIERHETLLRRAKAYGGYLDGPDGVRVKITKQEFPYDIGLYQNAKQAMGTSFPFWLWPLAFTPSNAAGFEFETNGFEDPDTPWPPPDPDRIPRLHYKLNANDAFRYGAKSSGMDIHAFRQRQQKDALRFTEESDPAIGQMLPEEQSHSITNAPADQSQDPWNQRQLGRSGSEWRDSAGDTLWDLGVDEEAEEDDLPLAEVLRRRKLAQHG
ncbi:MAG: hypothetical protein Q9225_001431 [Loekoesia sp. 1 TL-2023]